MKSSDNLTLPVFGAWSSYPWENSLCKLFFILCQINSIQPIPVSSGGLHRFLTPFTMRSIFYIMMPYSHKTDTFDETVINFIMYDVF